MYSRKFNQSSIPPDYSGVSFRQPPRESESVPLAQRKEDLGERAPRYPVEDRKCQNPPRKFKFKPYATPKTPPFEAEKKAKDPPTTQTPINTPSLLSHSFTMEDIVLAGLILLLLNSECDNELLLVLGFLLLVGLQ